MKQTILYITTILVIFSFLSCKNSTEDTVSQTINEKSPAIYRLPFDQNSPGVEIIDYNYTENDSTPRTIYIHAIDSAGNNTDEIVGMLTFHKNDKPYMGGSIKNKQRNGLWQSFYEDGTVWSEGSYKDGIEDGFYRVFYPNGQVRYEGNYDLGKMIGEWKYYDENGQLTKTETYNNEGQLTQNNS